MSTAANQTFRFGDQLAEFAKVTKTRLGEVHKNVSIKLFTAVVYDTPVLTGLARGSWMPSHGSPRESLRQPDMSGAMVIALINETITDDYSTVSWFVNNLPYIIPLEYGHSKTKAPKGMVRLNIARFQGIVTEEVNKAKSAIKGSAK